MQTSGHAAGTDNFYPRPPRGGRHIDTSRLPQTYTISIHALREEGDLHRYAPHRGGGGFLSTPSARRATLSQGVKSGKSVYFYPRPPRGGRLAKNDIFISFTNFYPRPPRGGRLSRFLRRG